jgi:photosystem II stability/assembly factor-like uncharacterized protein
MWPRRQVLMALGALAGCGGRGSDGAELVAPGTKLFDLQFVDAQTAYGVARQGLIARSDDGGQTWRRLRVESTADLISVFAVNRQLVFASALDHTVLRTVDGGVNWQIIHPSDGSSIVHGPVVVAPDADHVGLRIESNVRWGIVEQLEVTVNGGGEWRTTAQPGVAFPWSPGFTRSGVLFGVARYNAPAKPYAFWVSDDFGQSFRQTPLSGVACGTFGEQGIWLQLSSGGAASPPARVALSQDGFRTWVEAPMQVDGLGVDAQPEISVYALDAAGRGWAGTDSSLLHSSDGGRRWTVVAAPSVPAILVGTALDGLGWVTWMNGLVLWFSTDAGATWRRLDGVSYIVRDGGGGLLASVGSPQTGYTWQRSIDDGRNWRTLL